MFVGRSNPFVCWWRVTNCLVNDLERAKERNRDNGDGGGFFGSFVSEIITRDSRMARNPLDEDGRQNGVDRVADRGCSGM